MRELRLDTRRLTAAGYQSLAKLAKLEVLELLRADDAAVRHLAPLQRLWRLELSGTQATGRGVEAFPLLTDLQLGSSQADDAGLAGLGALKRLCTLNVNYSRVTGAGLAHLSSVHSLRVLSLSQQKRVADKDLVHLEGLKNLSHIVLYGTSVTARGINRLRKKVRGLEVTR